MPNILISKNKRSWFNDTLCI